MRRASSALQRAGRLSSRHVAKKHHPRAAGRALHPQHHSPVPPTRQCSTMVGIVGETVFGLFP
eukprot:4094341-Pyramimonas_sp.AAC.1